MFNLNIIVAVIIAMTFHEFGHAYISYKLGDPTPKTEGRLTLNPLKHIDIMGALMIVLVGFGWAKPVQIDSSYYKDKKMDTMLVSAAGPAMNFIIAIISTLMLNLNIAPMLFNSIMSINIVFGIFNLLPIPPLDGSKIISGFLPDNLYYKWLGLERYGFVILLIVVLTGILNAPLMDVTNTVRMLFMNIFIF